MIININQKQDNLYNCSAYHKKDPNGQDEKAKVNHGSVFVGDMKGSMQENVFEKKIEAQRKAMRKVINQFVDDLDTDQFLDETKKKKMMLEGDANELQDEINKLNDLQKELTKEAGIDPDSEEAKNLELLKKYQKDPNGLTQDELKQIQNMSENTEYQQRILDIESEKQEYLSRLKKTNGQIEVSTKTENAIKLASVKNHAMVETTKEAEKMMQEASKQVANALVNEAKEKQDEEIKEAKEAQKEKDEKKAKEEKAKEKREALNEQKVSSDDAKTDSEKVVNAAQDIDDMKNQVKTMLANKQLLEEDIKGVVVDETI